MLGCDSILGVTHRN